MAECAVLVPARVDGVAVEVLMEGRFFEVEELLCRAGIFPPAVGSRFAVDENFDLIDLEEVEEV